MARLKYVSPLVVLFAAVFAAAQSPTGFPPMGSLAGSPFDTVNLGSLDVHFEIPVVKKPGRGLPFSYSLGYDSFVWYPVGASGSQTWQPVQNWGWRGITEANAGYISYATSLTKCFDGGSWYWVNRYTQWQYHDRAGTVHGFNIVVDECTSQTVTKGTLDGSGYTMTVYGGASATVYSRSGTVIGAPLQSSSGAGTITDSNGNQLSTDGTTFTDTLGTTALTVSGSAPNPVSYTYAGPSQQRSVTATYASYTVMTNFACSGIAQYGPTAVYLLDTVTMTDGTTYSMKYETTPGYAAQGYVTGRIQAITLPTGGQISYAYTGANNGVNCADGSPAGLTRTTPDGVWTYTHTVSGTAATTSVTDPKGNVTNLNFQQIYETQRQVYQGSSALLETVDTCYNGAASPCTGTTITLPVTERTVTTQLADTGQTSKTDTFINSYGLPTEVDEYDLGSNAPGPLVRKTVTQYATLGNQINDRPSTVSIYDGANTLTTQTSFAYTQAVTATAGTPQLAAVSGDRGNVASISVQGSTTASFTYFDTGLVQNATDAAGNVTGYAYGNCGNSFISSVSLPLSLSRSMAWDCSGGVLTSSTDENGRVTSYSYTDPNYWRLTKLTAPDGGQTTTDYYLSTSPWNIVNTTSLSSTTSLQTKIVFDALGRPNQQQLVSDPEGATYTDQSYDGDGQVASVSNPYRSTSSGTTQYAYDALNRLTTKTQPDGNAIQMSYPGSCVISTDEAGKQRKTCFDALGRVASVFEPDTGNSLTLETDYQYDVLNNLTKVTQGTQTRTYIYDGLSRLTSVTDPESGTTQFYYTNGSGGLCNGDVTQVCRRTDARGITITYTYDGLHRLLSRAFSDGSPTVGYQYDQSSIWGLTPQNSKGRLTHLYNGNKAERVFSYDVVGRLTDQWECLPSNCGVSNYHTAFAYDLAGNLAQLTYPSGRQVTYTISAAGRVTQVQLTAFNGSALNYTYASSLHYEPSGAPTGAVLGNGLSEAFTYNNRLQLATAKLSSSVLTALSRSYTFADSAGKNNGNVMSIVDQLNSGRTQSFTYDNLNRIASAQTQTSSGPDCWGQTFGFDRFSNLLSTGYPAGYSNCSAPQPSYAYDGNNHVQSFSYDADGNLTGDGSHTYQYDPENRIKSLDSTGATYAYDADGMRVVQTVGSNTTEYILSGTQLLAEHRGSDWSDYVYVNGRRLVKADSYEDRIHIHGTNCSNCGSQYSLFQFPNAAGYAGYVIRSGDKLFLRQWQSSGAHGGMVVTFSDGTNTNWSVTDQDGNQLNNDGAQQSWHYRRADLSSYAGKTISNLYLVQENTTAAGAWDIYFNDISLTSTDGTVMPIYNRQTTISLTMSGTSGVTGRTYEVNHLAGIGATPDETTNYYDPDHLGSERMMTSVNGYPVWQATYLPFGYEYNQQPGVNKFKFTDYQRDSESGLDYAKFRYYSSQTARFMTPDPAGGDPANPQSWNRYAYALNNPLKYVDPLGLDCAYFNDAGNAIEEIDQFSDAGECGANGGYWVDGGITGFGFNDNGSLWLTGTNNGNDTTYAWYPGNSGSSSSISQGWTWTPFDPNQYFNNYYVQFQQPGGGGLDPSASSQAAMVAIHNAFAKFPTVCSLGINGSVGGNRVSVGVDANTNKGVNPFGQISTPVAPYTSVRYNFGKNGETPNLSVRVGPPTGFAGTMGFTPEGQITSVGANAQITVPGIGKAGATAYAGIGSFYQCK